MSSGLSQQVDVRRIDRVVAVMAGIHSGTGLMSSLLDWHPNVLSIPDNMIQSYYTFWEEYGHLPTPSLVSTFMDYYAVIFDAREQPEDPGVVPGVGQGGGLTNMGPNLDQCLQVDRERFRESITNIIGEDGRADRKLFFQALHVAYAEALGRKVTDPIIVFGLHVSAPSWMDALLTDFPDTLFLQMIRHPIQSVGSRFRHINLFGQLFPPLALICMSRGLDNGRPWPVENRARWRGVRLEDLHSSPSQTMRNVCDWLQLDWHDNLLESTFNGLQWWNGQSMIRINGFDRAVVSRSYDEYIPKFDRLRMDPLYARKCEAWGYQVVGRHRSLIARLLILPLLAVPFKMELMSISSMKATSPPERPAWFRVLLSLKMYGDVRLMLLKAWFRSFRRYGDEVEVL
jgi:hypothetical protein